MKIDSLEIVAIEAALAAGQAILTIYNDPERDFSIEIKSDSSPLTIADKRSHEVIEGYLKQTSIPVLSEEGREIPYEDRKEWPVLWIVDPLDGTKEFIKRNDEFTVNIALVVEGAPVMGVIYAPATGLLYYGSLQSGSFKASTDGTEGVDTIMGRAVAIPSSTTNEMVVVASRTHMSPETEAFIEDLKNKYGTISLRSSGSSLKLCLVADGAANIYPRFAPTMEWDTAAGHAILRGAKKELYLTNKDIPLTYNKESLLNPWFIAK